MIRRTIPATLFVDGTTHNTVPGLSKTVSIGPLLSMGVYIVCEVRIIISVCLNKSCYSYS